MAWATKAKAFLELGRISNLPTVWSNVLAAWCLSKGTFDLPFYWTLLGGTLLYVGGTALNDAFDASFDREHRPERPIPQGVISLRMVWILGGLLLLLGAFAFWQAGAWWLWILLLIEAILVYDWLHKRWAGSVWIMGGCRALLIITTASAAGGLTTANLFHALAIGLYVVGITDTARAESGGQATLRRWPFIFLFLPLFLGWAIDLEKVNSGLAVATLGGFLWIVQAIKKLDGENPARIGHCVADLLAGMVILDILFLAPVNLELAVWMVFLFALALVSQKWFAAT